MAMNVGPGNSPDHSEVMADINTTPLIDVMLVLLIMLIITIPVQLHAVNLNLPTGAPPPSPAKKPPEVVRIDIDASGTVFWNGEAVAPGAPLQARLDQAGATADQPEVHLKPHKDVAYEAVAGVLAAAQRAGVKKLGVTGNEQFL